MLLTLGAVVVAGCGGAASRSATRSTVARGPASGAPAGRAPTPASEVTALLAHIPQKGNALGNPRAPVTLQYFGDLQCPYCKRFTLGALTTLIDDYVRQGKLEVEYRSLRTATHNPSIFQIQQVAALAAGSQNKLWDFVELFYR